MVPWLMSEESVEEGTNEPEEEEIVEDSTDRPFPIGMCIEVTKSMKLNIPLFPVCLIESFFFFLVGIV